ncbi:MAG: YggT family protein [Dermatophilaceae bacterium]|jgi:YggT family protein|nr:YggT family protein [Actinomycetales bacterium]MBP8879598.1 YggT family protein [Dermatophilaceae bacterium]MBP9917435.1 YggT family protein [Dermatophilaceae bacterium]
MRGLWQVITSLLFVFFLFLVGRFILDWVKVFARQWRPRGVLLVVAEAIYTVTDPPLRFTRKIVPTLNLGGLRLDLAFLVLFLVTTTLMGIRF